MYMLRHKIEVYVDVDEGKKKQNDRSEWRSGRAEKNCAEKIWWMICFIMMEILLFD